MYRTFAAAAVAALMATSAQAALVATISGVAGANEVTWTFTGSAIAGADGFFNDDNGISTPDVWADVGDYTGLGNAGFLPASGAATLTIGSETRAIDFVWVDNDGVGPTPDDWGVSVDGTSNFTFLTGQEVSWSGAVTVVGLDILDLDVGGLPASYTSTNYGGVPGTLEGTLNIVALPPTPVPLPAGLPLLAAGLGGLALARRARHA